MESLNILELNTPDGRKLALDVTQIESIFEGKPTVGYFDKMGIWVGPTNGGCEINMRSGDRGKVAESYTEVLEALLNWTRER